MNEKTKTFGTLTLASGLILILSEFLGLYNATYAGILGCIVFGVATLACGIFEQ